jgi:hypothetical protein
LIFEALGDYHEINGVTYYMDFKNTFRHGDAISACRSVNMTFIDFSSEEREKDVVAYLLASNISKFYSQEKKSSTTFIIFLKKCFIF